MYFFDNNSCIESIIYRLMQNIMSFSDHKLTKVGSFPLPYNEGKTYNSIYFISNWPAGCPHGQDELKPTKTCKFL
jgi:hypothetical protein